MFFLYGRRWQRELCDEALKIPSEVKELFRRVRFVPSGAKFAQLLPSSIAGRLAGP